MSGYNPPRWAGVGAHVSPLAAKVFMVTMPRRTLEQALLRANAPAAARAEALDTWDAMKAAAMLYDQRAVGNLPPVLAVAPVEHPNDTPAGIMSADAAGVLLSLSGRRVRGLVSEGKLPGERRGNRLMVNRAAVEAMVIIRATACSTLPGHVVREAA